MASSKSKKPRFSVGQFVNVMQPQPGVDVLLRRARIASMTARMVKLPDGSTWRATDGYAWVYDARGRSHSLRIVAATGYILCKQGLYVQVSTEGAVLTTFSAATTWSSQVEAESVVRQFDLKGDWTVFDLATCDSAPVRTSPPDGV